MNRAQSAERNEQCFRLFLAGSTYAQIAKAVGLKSTGHVHQIVKRQLYDTRVRRNLLTDQALAIHQERQERLLQAFWVEALKGDQRSAEICAKILDQQCRVYGLLKSTPAGEKTMEDDTFDELARRRASRRPNAAGQ